MTSAILVTQILAQPAAANYAVPSSTRLPKPLAICDLNFTKQTHFPCQVKENNAISRLKSNLDPFSPFPRNRNIFINSRTKTVNRIDIMMVTNITATGRQSNQRAGICPWQPGVD